MSGEYEDFGVTPLELDLSEDTTFDILKPESQRAASRNVASGKVKNSVLKNFPNAFVRIAQMSFPDAQNQTDAIVAYMFCNCPEISQSNVATFGLTDAQKELIRNHEKNAFEDFSSRMQMLSKKLDKILDENFFIRMIALYHLYDRLGLNDGQGRYSPETAKNFDITHGGAFLDFSEDMESQKKSLKEITSYKNGKPW